MTYNLQKLAELVARTDDAIPTVEGRIQHWRKAGLFKLVHIDVGPERLGRGRVRQYPNEAVRWCRLWNRLAEIGCGIVEAAQATTMVQLYKVDRTGPRGRLVEDAFAGSGDAVFLAFDSMLEGISVGTFFIGRLPLDLPTGFRAGFIINLTEIYSTP